MTGIWTLIRLIVRRDRVPLLVWIAISAVLPGIASSPEPAAALVSALRARGEEAAGRAELLLCAPVGRLR